MRFTDGLPRWLLSVLLMLCVIKLATSPLLVALAVVVLVWTLVGEIASATQRRRRRD